MNNKSNILGNLNNAATDQRNEPAIWKDKELSKPKQKQTIKGKVGKAFNTVTPGSGGGGISSPLTEQLLEGNTTRTFYDAEMLYSSDGIFAFYGKPLKSLTFKDAKNSEVKLDFKNV